MFTYGIDVKLRAILVLPQRCGCSLGSGAGSCLVGCTAGTADFGTAGDDIVADNCECMRLLQCHIRYYTIKIKLTNILV